MKVRAPLEVGAGDLGRGMVGLSTRGGGEAILGNFRNGIFGANVALT